MAPSMCTVTISVSWYCSWRWSASYRIVTRFGGRGEARMAVFEFIEGSTAGATRHWATGHRLPSRPIKPRGRPSTKPRQLQ